jgi:hypothetical protein
VRGLGGYETIRSTRATGRFETAGCPVTCLVVPEYPNSSADHSPRLIAAMKKIERAE